MRANVSPAFDEFVARYQPLLLARTARFNLPAWEREECVIEVLESTILRFVKPGVQPPAEMAAYLTRTLYNCLLDAARAGRARIERERAASDQTAPAFQHAVTALASQHAIEGCIPDRDEPSHDLPPEVARLSRALIQEMSEEEQMLISWESNMIPHRTIAMWLGISHAAATKRVWRLRVRLREVASRHAQSLSNTEREDVEHFLHHPLKGGPHSLDSPAKVAAVSGPPYQHAGAMGASPMPEEGER